MRIGRTDELVEWAADTINSDGTAEVLIATRSMDIGRTLLNRIAVRLGGRDVLRRTRDELRFMAGGSVRIVSTANASRGRRCDLLLMEPDLPDAVRLAAMPTEQPR